MNATSRTGTAILLLAIALVACSRDDRPDGGSSAEPPRGEATAAVAGTAVPPASATPGRTGTAASPAIEITDCAEFGIAGRVDGATVECGYLVLPEDRAAPGNGRTVRLAVARYRSVTAHGDTPPLVWLDGGPGAASIEGMALVVGTAAGRLLLGGRDLLAGRDLVLLDQRGTGFSKPSLACPELEPFEAPGATDVERREAGAVVRAAFACRDRLAAEGIDLSAYTSAASAADVEDLRRALGVRQVDLYGVSYGTRLALTVMRDFPGSVRAAVLDSPVPVQATLYADIFGGAQRALDLVFQGCEADATCRARYPALERTYTALVERLNAAPLPLSGGDGVVFTGDDLTMGLFEVLYVTPAIPLVPALIAAVRDGRADGLIALLRQIDAGTTISQAMHLSVQCAEEAAFTRPEAVAAARAAVRPEIGRALGAAIVDEALAICAGWPVRPVPASEDAPVRSNVPALLLAGRHDPITPPAYAVLVAETLANGTVVEFAGVGHGALIAANACPYDIVWAFLRDPVARPDTSCAAAMPEPRWGGR